MLRITGWFKCEENDNITWDPELEKHVLSGGGGLVEFGNLKQIERDREVSIYDEVSSLLDLFT